MTSAIHIPLLPPGPHRPLGAATLTPDLQAAATALVTRLASGCVSTVFDECTGFQQAYVNAGGALTVDGLYGPATAGALQSVLTMAGSTTPAPAACVGSTGSTALAPSPTAPALPQTVTLPILGAVSTGNLILGAAAAFAVWLVGSAIYKHYADQAQFAAMERDEGRPRRKKRRKNPSKMRRIRRQARERAVSQPRNPKTGKFRRG